MNEWIFVRERRVNECMCVIDPVGGRHPSAQVRVAASLLKNTVEYPSRELDSEAEGILSNDPFEYPTTPRTPPPSCIAGLICMFPRSINILGSAEKFLQHGGNGFRS